jgi:G6PDH family F420-dependent oxidoreductase
MTMSQKKTSQKATPRSSVRRRAQIGYALSSEEHTAPELVRHAKLAADAGIRTVWISDHFHPWLHEQGQSPFVWSVIGAIGATTDLTVSTAVTCPTMRIHPAIVAHAAATSATMLDGRFELGVGSGENLNEHILGDTWPLTDVRLDMLEEAIEVIRKLWTGEEVTHRGTHYTVENARLYSLPAAPQPITMSGFGPKATDLAARIADGFVCTSPAKDLVDRYRAGGGKGLTSGSVKICWGADKDDCIKLAHHLWRTSGVPGELSQELRSPALFEQASELVTLESVAEHTPCGPDVGPIVEAVKKSVDAGFDRVFINQIGSNQDEFFAFFTRELAPALAEIGVSTEPR